MWRPAILQRAEAALLDEKASKLVGVARVLDQLLGDGFEAWLTRCGVAPDAPGDVRLKSLAEALRPVTDDLATAFPTVGLGYFDASTDRIVAYAPSASLGSLVGVSPPASHLGRVAMAEREDKLAVGSMVRGDAMNCMHPLVRGERVIGFTFANESLEDIYRQIHAEGGRHYQAAAALGLSSLAAFAGSTLVSAASIRSSLGPVTTEEYLPLLQGLDQIEQYVRLFLGNLQVGVVLVGADGRVAFCNSAMAELGGIDPGTVPGRPWPNVAAELGLPAEPGDGHRYARVYLGRGRTAVDLLDTTVPGARVLLFEDASRTRQDREYFERAERLALAGELATAIAHEIRNPLTVVAGSVQLIPQRLKDEEFLLSFSQIAGRELGRVNRTIQGLLGFARYSEPQMRPLDLGEVVGQAVEFIRWYAAKQSVVIEEHPAAHRLYVYGDAEHLQQALLNLMMNGIQAMQAGGALTIQTEHPGGSRFARIRVADQGPGIAPDLLPKIWDVFYSSKPGGTGLGLPVVQRIVDEHRGQVEVESAPGTGTCFTILLPLYSTPPDLTGEE